MPDGNNPDNPKYLPFIKPPSGLEPGREAQNAGFTGSNASYLARLLNGGLKSSVKPTDVGFEGMVYSRGVIAYTGSSNNLFFSGMLISDGDIRFDGVSSVDFFFNPDAIDTSWLSAASSPLVPTFYVQLSRLQNIP